MTRTITQLWSGKRWTCLNFRPIWQFPFSKETFCHHTTTFFSFTVLPLFITSKRLCFMHVRILLHVFYVKKTCLVALESNGWIWKKPKPLVELLVVRYSGCVPVSCNNLFLLHASTTENMGTVTLTLTRCVRLKCSLTSRTEY